jgi:hypothetical protein
MLLGEIRIATKRIRSVAISVKTLKRMAWGKNTGVRVEKPE